MKIGWRRPFEDPILIGDRALATLLDAGEYIAALPKKEHEAPEWRAAMEALLLVVERGGPTLFARIGIVRVNEGKVGSPLGTKCPLSGFRFRRNPICNQGKVGARFCHRGWLHILLFHLTRFI